MINELIQLTTICQTSYILLLLYVVDTNGDSVLASVVLSYLSMNIYVAYGRHGYVHKKHPSKAKLLQRWIYDKNSRDLTHAFL